MSKRGRRASRQERGLRDGDEPEPDGVIEVGRVVKLGDGVSRDAYGAALTVKPDPGHISDAYVVLLPRHGSEPELAARTRRELRLLAWLAGREMAFRVPRPLGALPELGGVALARAFVAGVPLDLRAGRQPSLRPWRVVAELAAAIHGLDLATAPVSLVGHGTRRDHALAELAPLETLEASEARDARAWAIEHLPPAAPATLVHGDLLGHNIVIDPTEPEPFAVVDWEYAIRGDPAHDLAIVTRGPPEESLATLRRVLRMASSV